MLHLIDNLSANGGAQQSIAQLAVALGRRGVDFQLAVLDEEPAAGPAPMLESEGVSVVSVGGPGGRLADVVRLRKLVRHERPDLLHTSLHSANLVGRFAGALAGVPVVTSIVSTKSDAGRAHRSKWSGRVKGVMSRAVARFTCRLVRRFHAVSPSAAAHVIDEFGVGADRVDIISRGRDRTRLGERSDARRQAVRAALGLSADDVVILAVGRHTPEKGFEVLVDALPSIIGRSPTAVLLIAGSNGLATSGMQVAIAALALGERVRLLGHRDDLGDLHSAADVFVLSSRVEGMPGALLEALAMGTPVVVTDIGPALDVVDAECALIVPVGSAAALADAVVACIADPAATAARVAAGSRRFDDAFDIDAVAAQMQMFYERALGR
ncbi:MAG: glycosyltransferase [Actinomycetota bacterium]